MSASLNHVIISAGFDFLWTSEMNWSTEAASQFYGIFKLDIRYHFQNTVHCGVKRVTVLERKSEVSFRFPTASCKSHCASVWYNAKRLHWHNGSFKWHLTNNQTNSKCKYLWTTRKPNHLYHVSEHRCSRPHEWKDFHLHSLTQLDVDKYTLRFFEDCETKEVVNTQAHTHTHT